MKKLILFLITILSVSCDNSNSTYQKQDISENDIKIDNKIDSIVLLKSTKDDIKIDNKIDSIALLKSTKDDIKIDNKTDSIALLQLTKNLYKWTLSDSKGDDFNPLQKEKKIQFMQKLTINCKNKDSKSLNTPIYFQLNL